MNNKIAKLYKNNYNEFIKLVKLLYPTNAEQDGLQKVLWDKSNADVSYFIINERFYSIEVLIHEMVEMAEKCKIFKKFNLV
jgi:hypothetical protein